MHHANSAHLSASTSKRLFCFSWDQPFVLAWPTHRTCPICLAPSTHSKILSSNIFLSKLRWLLRLHDCGIHFLVSFFYRIRQRAATEHRTLVSWEPLAEPNCIHATEWTIISIEEPTPHRRGWRAIPFWDGKTSQKLPLSPVLFLRFACCTLSSYRIGFNVGTWKKNRLDTVPRIRPFLMFFHWTK